MSVHSVTQDLAEQADEARKECEKKIERIKRKFYKGKPFENGPAEAILIEYAEWVTKTRSTVYGMKDALQKLRALINEASE